ncbi:hypothetical protein [Bacillus sp. OK048]|uniref:hypothetical protein n=1 Tax=Bacillus sp. OK048 TaxID=1882761 RepID=UPI000891B1FE|nr:hypothetical protein [Bacillus sp. OK048]SDN26221.1 hypothetical protein SAMN05443253_109218 [Bacillus sp. OK048]
MAILPLIIILIIIIAIVRQSKSSGRKNTFFGKQIRWVFGGYLAILVICAGLSPLLPTDEKIYKAIDVKDLDHAGIELYDAALAGNIDKVDSNYIKKTWNLDYQDQQLAITAANEEYIETSIIVERKTVNNGEIEAVYYKSRSSVNGMDISDLEKPLQMKIEKNTMRLENPEKLTLEFTQFQQAFPINQFTGKRGFSDSNSIYEGNSVLYLKVPKDLKINAPSELNVQYVE